MSIIEDIRSRRSVRTFDGNALKAEDAEKILAFAESAGNPYGLPVKWYILSAAEHKLSSVVIVGADYFIAGKMERAPHAEEAFGYSFEKVALFAQSLGVGTTCIAGTMKRDAFEKAVELKENEIMPCVSPLGYTATKMSIRESMMRKGIGADRRMDFSELFFDKSFDRPLTEENAGDFGCALEMVRLAPSAVNKQPWRIVIDGNNAHFYEKKGRGFVNESGWDIQKIDMGIAMSHFVYGIEAAGKEAAFGILDPGISMPQDTVYIATYTVK